MKNLGVLQQLVEYFSHALHLVPQPQTKENLLAIKKHVQTNLSKSFILKLVVIMQHTVMQALIG